MNKNFSNEDTTDKENNDIPEIFPIKKAEEELETESYHTDEDKSFRHRNWKKQRTDSPYANMKSYGATKFVIGEKVLAKWSDHRMQKFPAVIKTVVGDGNFSPVILIIYFTIIINYKTNLFFRQI